MYLAFENVDTGHSWDVEMLRWVINSANISFFIFLIPTSIMIDRCGPRFVTLFCAASVLVCVALRCIPVTGLARTVLITLSMLFNGMGGCWWVINQWQCIYL